MKRWPHFAALAAVALLTLRAAPCGTTPPPMQPLEIGNVWHYLSASGVHQVETITGTQTLLGRVVAVKSYSFDPDAGLENYWLTGPGGEVLLAGFNRPGFARAYDPPITVCGGAPSLGDTWPTHVTVYNLPDLSVVGVFDITFSAIEDETLGVPAGTFHCIGVGQVPSATLPTIASIDTRGLTLDGRHVVTPESALSFNATDWYSSGVGVVQYIAGETFQLAAYGNTTPTLTTTWGALKATYR